MSAPFPSFNPLDVYGLGVGGVSFGGIDTNLANPRFTPSHKLQHDPAVRRLKLACIIKHLADNRGTAEKPYHTFEELLSVAEIDNVDQVARNTLFADLKANSKVQAIDADHITFKPLHAGIANINDLEVYISKFTHGLPQDELMDAYVGVQGDIEVT